MSSVSKDTGAEAPPDPVKELFDTGVALLTGTGTPSTKARSADRWRRRTFGTRAVRPAGRGHQSRLRAALLDRLLMREGNAEDWGRLSMALETLAFYAGVQRLPAKRA